MDQQYTVCLLCFPQRDGLEPLHGDLAAARRRFLQNPRRAVWVEKTKDVKGFEGQVRGKLSKRGFVWKKKAKGISGGSSVLEEAFRHKEGWSLVVRDLYGVIVSRSFFNKTHAWVRTEYYEPWDSGTARVIFRPGDGVIQRSDWEQEKKAYRTINLSPAPYHSGTAGQSLVDAQLGVPQLVAATTEGELCFCPKSEAEARAKTQADISSGTVVLMPAWEVREGELLQDGGKDGSGNITFTSLEERAKIQPEEADLDASESREQPHPTLPEEFFPFLRTILEGGFPPLEFSPDEEPDSTEETLAAVETAGDAREVPKEAAGASPAEGPAPANAEASPAQAPPALLQPEAPSLGTPSQEKDSVEHGAIEGPAPAAAEPDSTEETLAAVETAGDTREVPEEAAGASPAERPAPANAEASPAQARPAVLQPEAPSLGTPSQEKDSVEHGAIEESAPAAAESDKDCVPGALESILVEAAIATEQSAPSLEIPQGAVQSSFTSYQGMVREGKITGRGRVQQPGGLTSYEGDYLDGKRHGFGAYYYKDGSLCYAGSWKNDRRDGVGVSFRESDHALHVANWSDGQPQGLVSLFDSEGSLRYSGRMENGKKEGAGVVVNGKDGTVFVGQWSGGEATGLGSAFDREGRLLYYGNWKDGKRHGHGTEFDVNGAVVFDGEFREGKYYNGVLYQKYQGIPIDDPLY